MARAKPAAAAVSSAFGRINVVSLASILDLKQFCSGYSALDRGAEYCDERVCVCVCVRACVRACVFVCPWSYLRNYTSTVHQISCARYLWAWLCPLLSM